MVVPQVEPQVLPPEPQEKRVSIRQIRKNCSRAFDSLSYLAYNIKKNFCLVILFIHIIQLSLFSSEYLPSR